MARIVYGVSGEGSGHAARAREIAHHLLQQQHDVRLVSYDRGFAYLKPEFDVFETEGLRIATRNNRVSIVRTFTDNLSRMPAGSRKLQQLRRSFFKEFRPECVITDFEPMTAYLARHYDVPLVSIDNQHRIRYVELVPPPGLEPEHQLTRTIIRLMVPRPAVVFVTTFFPGRPLNDFTFQFPPIVRQAVREKPPVQGDHVLVYLTKGFESLLANLRTLSHERFHVYGYDREGPDQNLVFCRASRERFLDDLARCKAVIGTAGFTLISEALFLKKPYFATPMTGQFEQELNAFQLHQSGYGRDGTRHDPQRIAEFLANLDMYRARLEAYPATDPTQITSKLDEVLAEDCRWLQEFHQRHGES